MTASPSPQQLWGAVKISEQYVPPLNACAADTCSRLCLPLYLPQQLESRKEQLYGLGPRAYMELKSLLEDKGIICPQVLIF
jgi:hypothetical protein